MFRVGMVGFLRITVNLGIMAKFAKPWLYTTDIGRWPYNRAASREVVRAAPETLVDRRRDTRAWPAVRAMAQQCGAGVLERGLDADAVSVTACSICAVPSQI
jgi:hypothetical protein